MATGIKNEGFDFSDMSGGLNTAFPRHALQKNQVAGTLNAIHEAMGVSRAPGYIGLQNTAMFSHPVRGMWTYTHDDGTESLIAVSNSKIYSVNPSTGALTEIGAGLITADAECYAVNAGGKLWIVNGTDFVKVENDLSAYRVQIAAPVGASAALLAGGSLAAGVYGVYVAYARKVSGQYLYSLPQSLGNLTTAGGNLSIRVTCAASADPQVTNRVVFMTDANGSVVYFYAEAANAAANIDVTSNATENQAILMSTVSAANQLLPISPDGIFTFNDSLFLWDINGRTIYWSLKTDVNPFDMERFLAQNFRTMSYSVNALFSVGSNLHLNHIGNGISTVISGDMSSVIHLTDRNHWFLDCKTHVGKSNVVMHKGYAFGLTNDGFRHFGGSDDNGNAGFSEDLSFHIKPDVDRIYQGIGTNNLPCACVNRRAGKRTEFRFSYRNLDYGTGGNNDQRVFNLDFYFDQNASRQTWEVWENGFASMASYGGGWMGAQSYSTGGQVVKEVGVSDVYCYSRAGAFLDTSILMKQIYGLTRTAIDDLDSITVFGGVWALATSGGDIGGNVIIFDANNSKFPFNIPGVQASLAVLPSQASGLGLVLPFIMAPQYPIGSTSPMPFDARGNSVAIEFSQIADDTQFFLYKLQLPRAKQIKNNLT